MQTVCICAAVDHAMHMGRFRKDPAEFPEEMLDFQADRQASGIHFAVKHPALSRTAVQETLRAIVIISTRRTCDY